MEPELQKLAGELEGKASIVKVDHDASPDLVEKYQVSGLPTVVLLKDGEEAGRFSGVDLDEIKSLIESAM